MHVIAGLEFRAVFALRGMFINARWTFAFASSATVSAFVDGTRGGCARRPTRGIVRTPWAHKYAKPSECRPADRFRNITRYFLNAPVIVKPLRDT